MKPRVPGGRTMRVATAITGVTGLTAAAAGFLPAAAAQAATAYAGRPAKTAEPRDGRLIRLKIDPGRVTGGPDNVEPSQPYWLNIWTKASVGSISVCGWHPTNAWRCTGWRGVSGQFAPDVGGNKHSWDRGTIDIAWNGGAPGHRDTCNTNGDYYGSVYSIGQSGYESVYLNAPNGTGIGNGVPEC